MKSINSKNVIFLFIFLSFFLVTCSSGGGGDDSRTIQINTLDKTTVDPLAQLTITGSGFDPANAAISVVLIPQSGGKPMVVPAISATATSVQIIVPPIFDPSTVKFVEGTVDVQVIQLAGSSFSTSNVLQGLRINAPPEIPSDVRPGAITAAFIKSGQDLIEFAQTNATTDQLTIVNDLNLFTEDLDTLLAAINTVINDPSASVILETTDSKTLAVNSTVLTLTDQLIMAYLQQHQQIFSSTSTASNLMNFLRMTKIAYAYTYDECMNDVAQYGEGISMFQTACGGKKYEQEFAEKGGKLTRWGAQFEFGVFYSVITGGIGPLAAELGVIGSQYSSAAQIAVNAFGSWAAPFVTGDTPQITPSLGKGILADIIDTAFNFNGILKATADFKIMHDDLAEIRSSDSGAPKGGVLISGRQQVPTGTTAIVHYPSGIQINTSNTQGTQTIACTYTYADWSACQSNNQQTRTVISSTPAGCTGTPVTSQSCTYTPPTCTYTYSDWSACQSDNTQTRTVSSSAPTGCTGTPVTSQSCIYIVTPPTCTYTYSAWSACQSDNTQSRSIISKSPSLCSAGNPITTQSCTFVCDWAAASTACSNACMETYNSCLAACDAKGGNLFEQADCDNACIGAQSACHKNADAHTCECIE